MDSDRGKGQEAQFLFYVINLFQHNHKFTFDILLQKSSKLIEIYQVIMVSVNSSENFSALFHGSNFRKVGVEPGVVVLHVPRELVQ